MVKIIPSTPAIAAPQPAPVVPKVQGRTFIVPPVHNSHSNDPRPQGVPITASEAQLVAAISKRSFFRFCQEFWETIVPEMPLWNWHIEYSCDIAQEAIERIVKGERKQHDIIINQPPGTTKSTVWSCLLPAWLWVKMPTGRYIGGSYTDALALELADKNRMVVQSDKYQECFRDIRMRKDMNTKSHFENTAGGRRYAVGVGGSVTGRHGHFLCVDDPINPESSESEVELATAARWCSETLPSRKVRGAEDTAVMAIIMQRLHEGDPTQAWLDKGTPVCHICLPAEASDLIRPPELASHYIDGLFDPVRFPPHVLRAIHAELGDYAYAGQYDQNPVPRGGGMFNTTKLKFIDPVQVPARFLRLCRYWDKAYTHADGCYTVGTLIGKAQVGPFNAYYVLDVVRGQWRSEEREDIILKCAKDDQLMAHEAKCNYVVGVEQEAGGAGEEVAKNTCMMLEGYDTVQDRVTGKKEHRAEPFARVVNKGMVYVVRAHWNDKWVNEYKYFPRSKYKDQVDSGGGAFTILATPQLYAGVLWK